MDGPMNEYVASVPASAILIGGYTHYTSGSGHALATPLPLFTTVQVTRVPGSPGDAIISDESLNEPPCVRSLVDGRIGHWSDLVVNCLRVASMEIPLPALKIVVKSEIPAGWGIAGSAALCVAVLRATKALIDANWFDEEIALLAHRAECEYVDMVRGKADQFATAHGRFGQATWLNTKSLRSRNYRLDSRMSLMVVDPGYDRDFSADDRRKIRLERLVECKAAKDRLGVSSLCDLGCRDLAVLSSLPANIAKRAWHVVTENLRALEFVRALEQGDMERQADLLAASHVSQRDDFECCAPAADAVVQSSKDFGVQGAKLVGDGYGGPVVALMPNELVTDWWAHVSEENPKCGLISTDVLRAQSSMMQPRWAVR